MTAPRRLTIDVVTSGATGAPGLGRWLASIAPARARGAMTVAIVPDGRVQQLNRRYRRKDAPTDVLSFPPPRLARRSRSAKAGTDVAVVPRTSAGISAMW